MIEKKKSFRGGRYFRRFCGAPQSKIEEFPLPSKVVIPLKQGYGEEVAATVTAGDKVKAGMIIGENNESISSPVHASVNGTVKEITRINYLGQEVGAVVIEADGDTQWQALEGATQEFTQKSAQEVGRLLYQAGVTALGSAGIPTTYASAALTPDKVEMIVVAALATDPLAFPFSALILDKPAEFVKGLAILHHVLPKPVHVAINHNSMPVFDKLEEHTKEYDWLHLHPVKPKYPQEQEEILVETLTGKVVPDGQCAADIGVVVLDSNAVFAAYEAVVEGKPLIERLVVLGGAGFKENLAVRLRVGTPLEEVARLKAKEEEEKRFIFGNVLQGLAQPELNVPIGRDIGAVAALVEHRKREFFFFMRPGFNRDSYSRMFVSSYLPFFKLRLETNLHGEPRPCIQCAYCADVCPRPLYPHLLAKYSEHGAADEVIGYRLMACIECGLCSYVCPSKIPLMTHIQKGKEQVRKEGLL